MGDNGGAEQPDTSMAVLTNIGHLVEKLPQHISIERDFGACTIVVAPSPMVSAWGVGALVVAAMGALIAFRSGDAGVAALYVAMGLGVRALVVMKVRLEITADCLAIAGLPLLGAEIAHPQIAGIEVQARSVVLRLQNGGRKVLAAGLQPEQANAFAEVVRHELRRIEKPR